MDSYNVYCSLVLRGVAQLGRALRSGRKGRWFESSHLDHLSDCGFPDGFPQFFVWKNPHVKKRGFLRETSQKRRILLVLVLSKASFRSMILFTLLYLNSSDLLH